MAHIDKSGAPDLGSRPITIRRGGVGNSPFNGGRNEQDGAHTPFGVGRRLLAATVVVPPEVTEHLNLDAMAVLAVIRDEGSATGRCTLPVARIAQRANVGRAKVRAAIRLAESLGLIAIEEALGRKRVIINRGIRSRL